MRASIHRCSRSSQERIRAVHVQNRRRWRRAVLTFRSGATHSKAKAPQVSPAPNPTITSRSPGAMRPASSASQAAIGMEADEVLP